MALGWSAVTLAGHTCLVLAVVMILWNAVVTLGARRDAVAVDWIAIAVILLGVGAVVERIYYIAARLLVNSDFNLWSLHPAPDLLSGIVAVLAFAVAVTVRITARGDGIRWGGAVAIQATILVGSFLALAVGLR